MSAQLQLVSGRVVLLRELQQCQVYESVLEGDPTTDDNARFIARFQAEFAARFNLAVELLAPAERILDEPCTRRGQPARIPAVACAARFVSFQPARDSAMHASTLAVLWFQDEFGDLDPLIIERLRALDWNTKATDFEW